MRRYGWLLIGLLVGVLIGGCSPSTPPPTPTPTPVPPSAPAVDYRAALAALDTYRARASLDFYPAAETGLSKGHLEVEVDAINRPARARRTTIRGLRSLAKPEERRKTSDVLKFIEVGGDLYMSTGTTWLKTPAQNDPEQGILDPGLLVPDPDSLTLAQEGVEVNGVVADHYRFDSAQALAYLTPEELAGVTGVQGDVWLARDGHFIVRYRAVVEGRSFRFDMSPDPIPGRLEVAYDIYGPNEPLTIERPQALGEDTSPKEDKPVILDGFDGQPLPMPVDAEVVMATRQVAIFNTGMVPEEVVRFYAQALSNGGWQLTKEEGKKGMRQTWQRAAFQLNLVIVAGQEPGEPTHVTIGVNPVGAGENPEGSG